MIQEEDFINIWGERDAVIGEHTLYPDKDSLQSDSYDQYYIIKCYADENMTLADWVWSKYSGPVNIDNIIYNGATYSNTSTSNRSIFTTPVIRSAWNIQSGVIYSVEQVKQLQPVMVDDNYDHQVWGGEFYEVYDTVSLRIEAEIIPSWSYGLNSIINNLPFRNQDERATYITCKHNVLGGGPSNEQLIDYNGIISDGAMFLCNVLPVYGGQYDI